MSDQPILGSVAWMNYTMAKVNPVYDTSPGTVVLTNQSGTILTSDDGTFQLTPDVQAVVTRLVRWI